MFLFIIRPSLRYSLQGIRILVDHLDKCLADGVDRIGDNTAELCCESLKIVFNLLLWSEKPASELSIDPDDETQLQYDLLKIIRKLLLVKSKTLKKQEELKR